MSRKETPKIIQERKALARVIREKLDELGKDLTFLSQESGVCKRSIKNWCSGKTTPDYISLLEIAQTLYGNFGDMCRDIEKCREEMVIPMDKVADKQMAQVYIASVKKRAQESRRKENEK